VAFTVVKCCNYIFSISHRYTGKRICAVPCDGIDDLCLNNEDEDCQESFILLVLASLILSIALTVVIGEAVVRYLISRENGNDCELFSDVSTPGDSFEKLFSDFITNSTNRKKAKSSFKVFFSLLV
jgi:hypothetical protein